MNAHKILTYLAIKFHGEWDEIFKAIRDRQEYSIEEMESTVNNMKSKAVTILDPDYPEWLKNVYKPPFVLFYYGDLSLTKDIENNLAVIGSREPTDYGKNITEYLVKNIRARYTIVSGLARGIDSIAHQAAIDSGAKTIAVLGSGIDYCYPPRNKELYEVIKKNHLVISEYPGDEYPDPSHFPARNRLVAAFSHGVLVTDAQIRSGTLITVEFALATNKEVMCVPHRITDNSSCNRLIADGAFLIESAQDIIDIMSLGQLKK